MMFVQKSRNEKALRPVNQQWNQIEFRRLHRIFFRKIIYLHQYLMVALTFYLGLELFSYVLTMVNRLRILVFLKECTIPFCVLLKFSDKGVGRNEAIALWEAWGRNSF